MAGVCRIVPSGGAGLPAEFRGKFLCKSLIFDISDSCGTERTENGSGMWPLVLRNAVCIEVSGSVKEKCFLFIPNKEVSA